MDDASELIYVHDPMCSWCWGFRPVYLQLCSLLGNRLRIRRLLGGLAADSDQPMPMEMREQLQQTWRRIQQRIPGTCFNFDFWDSCEPRRSTFPACRAVLAARALDQNSEDAMTLAIQQAYYLRALNPSDQATLVRLAVELGLDEPRFSELLHSDAIDRRLRQEIAQSRAIGAHSFPSLILRLDELRYTPVTVDYTNPHNMQETIETLIE